MNTTLWILQGVLAAIMLMAGIMKATKTKDDIKAKGNGSMDWVDDVSAGNIKAIGILEILIAVGLILPILSGLPNWLTPLAAVGAVCAMIGALALHIKRKDGAKATATNLFIMALAIVIVVGRMM